MSIRSLIVKVGANVEDLDKALARAGSSIKRTDTDLKKLGGQPIGEPAKRSLDTIAKTVDALTTSQQKYANNARLAAIGLEQVGGAARLTRSELDQIHRTLQNGIDAYRALGQQAPKSLLDVAAAVKQQRIALDDVAKSKAGGFFDDLGGQLAATAAGFLSAQAVIGGVQTGFRTLSAFVKDSVTAFAEAEAAQKKLVVALEQQGTATPQVIGQYNDLATSFQQTTAFSDDLINSAQGLLVTIGNVMPSQMEKALEATTNLAAGLGVDLEQAARIVGKAAEGNTGSLQKLGVTVSDTAFKARGLDAVLDALNDRFGGQAQAQLDTYAGKIEQAKNLWNNFQETVGRVIVTNELTGAALRTLSDGATSLDKSTGSASVSVAKLVNALGLPIDSSVIAALESWAGASNRAADAAERQAKAAADLQNIKPIASHVTVGEQREQDLRAQAVARKAQEEQQENLAKAAKRHAEALEQVNAKIREATRPVVALTDRQKDLLTTYQALGLSNEEIALVFGVSRTSVDAYSNELEDAFAEMKRNREETARFQQSLDKLAVGFDRAGKVSTGFRDVMRQTVRPVLETADSASLLNSSLITLGQVGPKGATGVEKYRQGVTDAADESKRTAKILDELSGAFARLAQTSGGAFAGVAQEIGNVVSSLSLAKDSVKAFRDASKPADKAVALASGVASVSQATGSGSTTGRALGGALTGAQLGSLAGPVGTVVGGIVGGLTGIIRGLIKPEFSKVAADVGRDWGANISDGLAKQIAKDSPRIGRQAATLLNLDSIIGESGGVASFGLDKAIKGTRDLFVMLGQGKLTAQQVGGEFDKLFGQIVPNAIEKSTGLASAAFVDLLKTAQSNNVESPGLTSFVDSQLGGSIGGLDRFLSTASDASKRAAEIKANLASVDAERSKLLGRSLSESEAARASELDKQWDALKKQLATAEKLQKVTSLSSQGAATGAAGGLLAAFAGLQQNGTSITDAVKAVSPAVDALGEQLQRTGFAGGAAFETLRGLVATASDEIAGPALDAVGGLGDALAGLSNTGLLNQETFAGLSGQVASTFDQLVAQGTNGDAALQLMQPTLQRIFELQEQFGFQVDESTDKLLKQAEAEGIVGDKFKSAGDRTVDALGETNKILQAIAERLGADLPKAAKEGAKGVEDAFKKLNPKVAVDIVYHDPGLPVIDTGQGAATGGIVTPRGIQHLAGGGRVLPFLRRGTDTVPAMLTPGEIVLNAAQQRAVAGQIGGIGNAVSVVVNVNGYVDSPEAQRRLGRIVNEELGRLARRQKKFGAA